MLIKKAIFFFSFILFASLTFSLPALAITKEKYFDKNINQYVDVAAGEIIVKFKSNISKQSVSKINDENSIRIVREIPSSIKLLSARTEGKLTSSVEDLLNKYKNDPRVEYAHPNFILYAMKTTPNDPSYALQWALPQIKADLGWDIEKGSSSVVIAVIDSGVELAHEDLADKIWKNEKENSGNNKNNGVDDDKNTYVDDYQGWDFIDWDNSPNDSFGHGTHVGGIAAANTDNSKGIAGVSWNSKIMPVRILNGSGEGNSFDFILGMRYAADSGAKVINLSLGGPSSSESENEAVQYAHNKGCVIIAAAGNQGDSTIYFPASFKNVISVGSVDKNDLKSDFSNYNAFVDVCAPGGEGSRNDATANIYSSFITGTYTYEAGTSMAAPYVAGLASLIFSKNPNWTNKQVEEQIISTVDDLGPAGRDDYFGYGRINVFKALNTEPVSSTFGSSISYVSVYPNPFKLGLSAGIVFGNLKGDEKIGIYTSVGELLAFYDANVFNSSSWTWDLKNYSDNEVVQNVYLYVITNNAGRRKVGKIAVVN